VAIVQGMALAPQEVLRALNPEEQEKLVAQLPSLAKQADKVRGEWCRLADPGRDYSPARRRNTCTGSIGPADAGGSEGEDAPAPHVTECGPRPVRLLEPLPADE
jgi:hypothetical protein